MIGHFMAARAWPGGGTDVDRALRARVRAVHRPPAARARDRALLRFPSAVFMMSFMSFFIGTFLQLMWEDIPITEPL
jgi:hypothetical protein